MPARGEERSRVLIAGGGIGGLAASVGLLQKGYAALVLEKAPALGEIGAGIQILIGRARNAPIAVPCNVE